MIWVLCLWGKGAVNKAELHLTMKLAAHTHTHTHTHTQTKSYAWWKNIYLKHIHILENVVNICIINDLSYPPATHPQIIRMHIFYYPTSGLSTAPADITAIQASLLRTVRRYQQHHWVVKLPSWGNLYVSIVWEGCFSYKICNWTTLEYIHLIIHIMRFGPYKLRVFYRRWM